METKYYGWIWILGIVTYGFGDLITTFFGISVMGAVETNYLPKYLIDTYGMWVFIPIKIGVIGGLYWINTYIPRPYNLPCPILFSIFGLYAMANNTHVILSLM